MSETREIGRGTDDEDQDGKSVSLPHCAVGFGHAQSDLFN